MIKNDHKYTQEELDALTIHDLRIVLCKIGGVPKLKNRQVLVEEILKIQDGAPLPPRSKRGRKPKYIKIEQMEMEKNSNFSVDDCDNDGFSADGRFFCPPERFSSVAGEYDRGNGERHDYVDYSGYEKRGFDKRAGYLSESGDNSGYEKRGFDKRAGYLSESGDNSVTVADNDVLFEKTVIAQGVLEIMESGYGFLRTYDCHSKNPDFYVDRQMLKRFGLRTGDFVTGYAVNKFDKSSLNVREIISVNGIPIHDFRRGKFFDDYTPIYPEKRLVLSAGSNDYALRAIDMVAPIGMGQRGLIVAPPKTGKTTLLKKIARAIETNYPEVYLIVLLIDERPEEVTDFAEVVSKAEVVSSTFDESPEKHVRYAEIYLERAKRLVEAGKDVVILMDSITKLARAYNNVIPFSGKTLSGGVDPQALTGPKKFFGAARNYKDGASLTIISTALVETGSRMDDVIFEEFKGTGNMEIVLSRYLSERRIFPAIDLFKSGTRNEEYLFDKTELDGIYKLRRLLGQTDSPSEAFLEMVQTTSDNVDLLNRMDAWIKLFEQKK